MINALRLMYTGLGASILAVILAFVDIGHLSNLAAANEYSYPAVYHRETVAIGYLAIFAVVPGIIALALWPLCAWAIRKGRLWGAILGTIVFGIDLICMLCVLLGTHEAPASKIMSLVVWGLGLVVVILLWQRPARAFFSAFK